jgi:hypothetical protein
MEMAIVVTTETAIVGAAAMAAMAVPTAAEAVPTAADSVGNPSF